MINLRFFPSRRLAFYTVKLFVTRSLRRNRARLPESILPILQSDEP